MHSKLPHVTPQLYKLIIMNIVPLVSIVLPVRNAEKCLSACLESLRTQTYANLEVLAIDDNSTDASFAVLQNIRKTDKRFRVYKNKKNYGLAVTINRAFRRAKGDFIAFMGAHDVCSPKRIQKQVEFLMKNEKVAAVGTQGTYIGTSKRALKSDFPIDHENILKQLLSGKSVQPESVMIQKKALPKDILKVSAHSYPFIYTDLLMNISQYTEIANLPHALYTQKKRFSDQLSALEFARLSTTLKHWIRSFFVYEQRPSLKSLLSLW